MREYCQSGTYMGIHRECEYLIHKARSECPQVSLFQYILYFSYGVRRMQEILFGDKRSLIYIRKK